MADQNNSSNTEFDNLFDLKVENDNFFDNLENPDNSAPADLEEIPDISEISTEDIIVNDNIEINESVSEQKRTSKDFNLDMDAILITAQSPMIIEAMKYYTKSIFSAKTLKLYKEALNGVEIYIKILDRNPQNYKKLKSVVLSDPDCIEVEKIAFELFEKAYEHKPQINTEKLKAFELFSGMLKTAVDKASIYTVNDLLKSFFHLSGDINIDYTKNEFINNNSSFRNYINLLNVKMKLSQRFLKQVNLHLLDRKERTFFNKFIAKASLVIYHYFMFINDSQNANFYQRLHENYIKYYM